MTVASQVPLPAPPSRNLLLSAPILPTLMRLALPNMAAMLTAALVAISETAYVGILGTTQLAAIALVFPMVMLMQMLSAGAMGGGVSSAVSRALGAGDTRRAEAIAVHAIVIGVCAGVAFTVLFLAFGRRIYGGLGGGGRVLEEAVAYSNVAFTGAVAIWGLNTLASIVRGTGDMKVPSAVLLVASAVQIALGGALGLGLGPLPRLGLAGVAVGLVGGFTLCAGFLLWYLRSGRARIQLRFEGVRLSREVFGDILKVGGVAALSPLQSVLTVLVLTRLVAVFGTEALAGYGIGARLEFLLVPIVFAIGVACVPMVGMAIGAHQIERARQVAWTGAGLSAAIIGVIGILVAVVSDAWSGLFTTDPNVRAVANLYLQLAGPAFALFGLGLCLYFASQGSGKVLGPVLAGTIRLVLIVVGGLLLEWSAAPLWLFFALVAASMVAYGVSTAAIVYATPWGSARAQ
jgi:putative MATE family efflux protein